MKKPLTLLVCLAMISMLKNNSAFAEPDGDSPKTLIEYVATGLPAPELLPSPIIKPEGLTRGFTFYDDRNVFNSANPGLPVEGFENSTISPGVAHPIPHPLDASSDNAYFNPGDILNGIQFWATSDRSDDEIAVLGASYLGSPSKTIVANYYADGFRIVFNPPVSVVGMDVQDFFGTGFCTVEMYGPGGTLMGSVVTAANPEGVFWGVASDNPIEEIIIESQGEGAQGADNIAFGNPLPAAVPLSDFALYLGVLLMLTFMVIHLRKVF